MRKGRRALGRAFSPRRARVRGGLASGLSGMSAMSGMGIGGIVTCTLSTEAVEPVTSLTFEVAITFSASVTDFTVDDIDVTNASLSDFAGSGADYTVTVTPDGAGETITLQVAAGVTTPPNLASNTLEVTASETAFSDDFSDADPTTNGWYSPGGGTIANVGGRLVITPTRGANIMPDSDFATGVGWTYGTGWTYDAVNLEADALTLSAQNLSQSILTADTWYLHLMDVKNWVAGTVRAFLTGVTGINRGANGTGYRQTGRATGTPAGASGFNGSNLSVDNIKVYALTRTTLFALRDFDFAYGEFTLNLRRGVGVDIGLALNYQDANNHAIIRIGSFGGATRVFYDKRVAGVTSNVGNWAITYIDNKDLVVARHEDGTIDITYNSLSVVIGAAASGSTGLAHGIFAADDVLTDADSFAYARDF